MEWSFLCWCFLVFRRAWGETERDMQIALIYGQLVHANNVARAAKPYTDKVDIALQAGWNTLLLKNTQNGDVLRLPRVCVST